MREGESEAKAIKKQQSLVLTKTERCWVIFMVWITFMFLSMLVTVIEWPYLVLKCEIVYIQQKNIRT